MDGLPVSVPPPASTTDASTRDKLRTMPPGWLQLQLGLDPDAAMLRGQPGMFLLMERLEREGRTEAALRLAAYALPPREAVWWACMCARHTVQAEPVKADAAAAAAAEEWVRRPDDAARARAYRAARQARYRSAEAMAAMGVYWSRAARTSSMSDAAAGQVGHSIENAVRLASVRGPLPQQAARLRAFLRSARDIAMGGAGHIDGEAGLASAGAGDARR